MHSLNLLFESGKSGAFIRKHYTCNLLKVIGSVGHPIKDTKFKVVDSETGEVLPPGSKGMLKVKGPPLMKGYYKVIYFVKMQTYSVLA